MKNRVIDIAVLLLDELDEFGEDFGELLRFRRRGRILVLSPLFWIVFLDLLPELFDLDLVVRWWRAE